MNSKFPIFCWTFARTCPEPDTSISLEEFIGSPSDVTELENKLGEQLRKELKRLGPVPIRRIPVSVKRPSIECRILNFK
ncbi:hypothetical protein EDD58_102356 [Hazenella coriacea]|uniref:Uncharacterized protein n=1 Tax=Hazenella coriacea TaxID=1179467 RepID=A0A4R3L9J2_9BACL|nr:hypothetical protein EDD58_102356 [Hazenella coriacea]